MSYFTNTPVNPTFYAELAAPQSLNKYQYCYNNPLRLVDPDGHQPEQIAQRILSSPTGQQIINAAGAAITVTIVAASGAVQKLADSASKYDTTCPECSWERNPITEKFNPSFYRNNSQNNSGNQTQQGASQSNQSSAANPNPNDPDKKPVFGERGTQTTSTTVGKGQGYRIDVENPNPGQRPGQIHYQSGDKKYLYDPNTKSFVGASKSENKRIINDPIVQRAIDKALKLLGEN